MTEEKVPKCYTLSQLKVKNLKVGMYVKNRKVGVYYMYAIECGYREIMLPRPINVNGCCQDE